MLGTDPLAFFRDVTNDKSISYINHLVTTPEAFSIILPSINNKPDFFKRYPSLWKGSSPKNQPVFIACSENGVPLLGRVATSDESDELGKSNYLIKDVKPVALISENCKGFDYLGLIQKGKKSLIYYIAPDELVFSSTSPEHIEENPEAYKKLRHFCIKYWYRASSYDLPYDSVKFAINKLGNDLSPFTNDAKEKLEEWGNIGKLEDFYEGLFEEDETDEEEINTFSVLLDYYHYILDFLGFLRPF